jgi:microbial collagenase
MKCSFNRKNQQTWMVLRIAFVIMVVILSRESMADAAAKIDTSPITSKVALASVEQVLSQVTDCNATIVIRSQSLDKQQLKTACQVLIAQEVKFHETFNTLGQPVADDNNSKMRANIYSNRDEFVKYATAHFTMPTNNGGMYLEGYPDKEDNQAEFVAYERSGKIWNLKHEYVHYLDGRFNKYGDYCNGLHDDHAGPEFCPSPNLSYPHIVWWAEGLGEYMAHGKSNPKALELAKQPTFVLSELFNTSSNENTGADRVYRWGYLAVRFMMENHREEIEQMLTIIRSGQWQSYQQLIRQWGTSFDGEFSVWLQQLELTASQNKS